MILSLLSGKINSLNQVFSEFIKILIFQVIEPSQVLFSLETLIITVSAGAVAALVVGFVTGYCCGRRCHKDSEAGALAHLGYQV